MLKTARVWSRLGSHLLLIIGACFFFGPVLIAFSQSFQTYSQIVQLPPTIWPHPFSWSNFSGALASFPFWQYLYNTVVNYGLLAFAGTFLTAPMTAFALSRLRSRYRNVSFLLLLVSMMVPGQAVILPQYIGFAHLHLLSTYVPLVIANWLGEELSMCFFFDSLC